MTQPSAQELSPRLQFGQKEVGHLWDAATKRQEWDLHSWTKREEQKKEFSNAPLEIKVWLRKISIFKDNRMALLIPFALEILPLTKLSVTEVVLCCIFHMVYPQ